MKIKVQSLGYDQVIALPRPPRIPPRRPHRALRMLLKLASAPELRRVRFQWRSVGMDRLAQDEPCLILMNHSSFIDLKIAATVLYPRPFHIVCTSDGFIGKAGLMRALGCIPTNKFVTDTALVRDIRHAIRDLHDSVLMYPEASYSFDGTATPLPESLGKLLKLLRVPVVMIETTGAFARDPLYNGLQLRQVQVQAQVTYALSPAQIDAHSVDELNKTLAGYFSFDYFRWQQEQRLKITEPFRADGLNRVLYKCPHCRAEHRMTGRGALLTCGTCGKVYELTEDGAMRAQSGDTEFAHIPDWYRWERDCVRAEIEAGTYALDTDVDICMMVDFKCLYRVGTGTLHHDAHGFRLDGCGGRLHYTQPPQASYSLYADYFWYELGDVICIGDARTLYYCFPKTPDVVARTRLAAEELYKIVRKKEGAALTSTAPTPDRTAVHLSR